MSSVSPQILPSINTAGIWHSSYEYRWHYSSTGYEHYQLIDVTNDFYAGDGFMHSIKVNTSTNTWLDDGSADPVTVTETTNGTVQCFRSAGGGQLVYEFTKPTTASWIYTPPVETLVKTVDNTPAGGGTTSESFDPAAWLWYWYSVDNQSDDIVRVNIINIVSQQLTDFSAFVTDKVSGITSAIQGAVIANDASNPSEYVVTINLPEQTIKDNIIFITDDTNNSNVIGEVDFEPASQVVVGSRRGSLNFW